MYYKIEVEGSDDVAAFTTKDGAEAVISVLSTVGELGEYEIVEAEDATDKELQLGIDVSMFCLDLIEAGR